MKDDSELLTRYANDRSEAAFTELVQRHVDMVYSAALRQMGGDLHRAQEVTQMVFTDLARKAASLASHPALPAWLHRNSHLTAAALRRKEGRRQKYERAAADEAIAGSEEPVVWENLRPVLDEAINDLGERDRQAVLLRFFSNRPFGEVGRQLGLTENAARMRVERALGKLHGLLARRGITSSSAALAAALTARAVAAAPAGVAAATAGAALVGASGAAGLWATFMISSKLPFALTAAVLVGGASIVALQERASHRDAEELAGLLRENRALSALKEQNRRLAAAAEQARALEANGAHWAVLQAQVQALEGVVATQAKKAAAAAQARKLAANRARSAGVVWDDDSKVVDASGADRLPTPVSQKRPAYPIEMRQAGSSGQVVVDVVVGTDGLIHNAFAASSTQSEFEAAAVQAVSQWTFNPGQKNGIVVNTHLQIPIVFSVSPGSSPSGFVVAPAAAPAGDSWF